MNEAIKDEIKRIEQTLADGMELVKECAAEHTDGPPIPQLVEQINTMTTSMLHLAAALGCLYAIDTGVDIGGSDETDDDPMH